MILPLPNLDDRKLSMREQVIARLRQLNPDVQYREEYLNTLKDFDLLQSLEIAIIVRLSTDLNDQYQQEQMEEGEPI